MTEKMNNYALHYQAQLLADTNTKYRLARRIIELEEKIKEYEEADVVELDAERRILPCVCGHDVSNEDELIDSLYPANRERTKWQFGCMVHNMGCGRHVYGDSKEEVVSKWNCGVVDEYIKD